MSWYCNHRGPNQKTRSWGVGRGHKASVGGHSIATLTSVLLPSELGSRRVVSGQVSSSEGNATASSSAKVRVAIPNHATLTSVLLPSLLDFQPTATKLPAVVGGFQRWFRSDNKTFNGLSRIILCVGVCLQSKENLVAGAGEPTRAHGAQTSGLFHCCVDF
uniref:Uncharacterized protein n=1 Tax=Chrysemys picta bellii TaxID=8478 RepID=A0A8C3FF72_CHRPI